MNTNCQCNLCGTVLEDDMLEVLIPHLLEEHSIEVDDAEHEALDTTAIYEKYFIPLWRNNQ